MMVGRKKALTGQPLRDSLAAAVVGLCESEGMAVTRAEVGPLSLDDTTAAVIQIWIELKLSQDDVSVLIVEPPTSKTPFRLYDMLRGKLLAAVGRKA
jgi:hypothetical protein